MCKVADVLEWKSPLPLGWHKMPPREGPIPTHQRDHDAILRRARQRMQDLTADFAAGRIDGQGWYEAMDALVWDMHTEEFLVGYRHAGGEIGEGAAREIARIVADRQSQFLLGFRNRLEDRDPRYVGEGGEIDLDSGALNAHLDLTALQGSGTASAGFYDGSPRTSRWDWDLNGAVEDHCEDCPAIAAMSPLEDDEVFTTPRAGDTSCLGNCTCSLDRLNDDDTTTEGFGPYRP